MCFAQRKKSHQAGEEKESHRVRALFVWGMLQAFNLGSTKTKSLGSALRQDEAPQKLKEKKIVESEPPDRQA